MSERTIAREWDRFMERLNDVQVQQDASDEGFIALLNRLLGREVADAYGNWLDEGAAG